MVVIVCYSWWWMMLNMFLYVYCPFCFYLWRDVYLTLFFKVLFIVRERGREGEREGEKHQCVVELTCPIFGDLACNPGMCPDWESNQQPFGSQANTQSTEPHQSGITVVYTGWIIVNKFKKYSSTPITFYLFLWNSELNYTFLNWVT